MRHCSSSSPTLLWMQQCLPLEMSHGSQRHEWGTLPFPELVSQNTEARHLSQRFICSFPFICRYRLTALAVDSAAGPNKNYTVVFIGSEAGIVLKVLAKSSPFSLYDSVLLEEIDVFNRAKYVGCVFMPLISFVWSFPKKVSVKLPLPILHPFACLNFGLFFKI